MMIGIVVFSMLMIGGMVASDGSATTTNGTMSGSQNPGAAKKTAETKTVGQGQSQSSNQSQPMTQTQQTTKKQLQKNKTKEGRGN